MNPESPHTHADEAFAAIAQSQEVARRLAIALDFQAKGLDPKNDIRVEDISARPETYANTMITFSDKAVAVIHREPAGVADLSRSTLADYVMDTIPGYETYSPNGERGIVLTTARINEIIEKLPSPGRVKTQG